LVIGYWLLVIGYWLLVVGQNPAQGARGVDWTRQRELAHRSSGGSFSFRARARASAFLAGARNRARYKRQEKIRHALELPETGSSTLCPALPYF
jgi:hypothetical protein